MSETVSPIDAAAPDTPALTRTLLVTLAVIAALAIVARAIPQPRTIDDAFITFRYSRNIVDGNGFVYNPDERTLGTTTPFFTALMAAIGWVTGSGSYPWFALWVNAAADACTAVLLALIAYRLSGKTILAAILGGIWVISPMSVTFAVGGMETSVVILWCVATIYAYLHHWDRWMAVFAALGILTRIDALIWVGPILAHHVLMHWRATRDTEETGWRYWLARVPWQSWLIFGLVLAPWYLFSWTYFGTLISRSLSAKRVAYAVPDLHALTRLLQHVATPFFEHLAFGVPGIVVGLVLYPGLAASGTLYASKRFPRLLPFLLYPWLYVIAFSIMNPLIFRWYLAPILPAYFLAILLGVWALSEAAATAAKRARVAPGALAVAGTIFATLALNAWTLEPDHGPDRPAPQMAWHDIELNYKKMGEKLRSDYCVTADTVVSAGDIGAVGYYSRATILDTVGLITPEMSEYYPLTEDLLQDDQNYAVPPDIIFDHEPEYIVFMEMFVRDGLMGDELRQDFQALYDEVYVIPTDYYGDGMLLYQHVSANACDIDSAAP
ncbi:MAG: hypothetical protein GYB65_04690 [Chloroflexi bacterium]|nr:hypothetical protein [Chloroflexota bacterium]